MQIALSGSHRLAGSNGTKPLALPCAPNPRRERLNLVRSRKQSQTLIKEWKYIQVCHMTPPSRRICPLGPCTSNLVFWIVCYLYPGWPGAANPWAPGLENCKGDRPARAEPVAARLLPKLNSCKSLSECCAARAGAEPGLVVGWYLGSENAKRGSPNRVKPVAARV